jgi:hypothetical protein
LKGPIFLKSSPRTEAISGAIRRSGSARNSAKQFWTEADESVAKAGEPVPEVIFPIPAPKSSPRLQTEPTRQDSVPAFKSKYKAFISQLIHKRSQSLSLNKNSKKKKVSRARRQTFKSSINIFFRKWNLFRFSPTFLGKFAGKLFIKKKIHFPREIEGMKK